MTVTLLKLQLSYRSSLPKLKIVIIRNRWYELVFPQRCFWGKIIPHSNNSVDLIPQSDRVNCKWVLGLTHNSLWIPFVKINK